MTTEWKDITDPEELFRLKREGWEIEVGNYLKADWQKWEGTSWYSKTPYRARPRQPKMKKVKTPRWIHNRTGTVFYGFKLLSSDDGWIRQPHLDLEWEVPE